MSKKVIIVFTYYGPAIYNDLEFRAVFRHNLQTTENCGEKHVTDLKFAAITTSVPDSEKFSHLLRLVGLKIFLHSGEEKMVKIWQFANLIFVQ